MPAQEAACGNAEVCVDALKNRVRHKVIDSHADEPIEVENDRLFSGDAFKGEIVLQTKATIVSEEAKPPRFVIGDNVLVIGPTTTYSSQSGTVVELNERLGVYRYLVEFPGGKTAMFYGFELEKSE